MHPIPRRGFRVEPPKNLPTPKDHLHAKFHLDPSSSLDFNGEHTDRHTHIALYVLEY